MAAQLARSNLLIQHWVICPVSILSAQFCDGDNVKMARVLTFFCNGLCDGVGPKAGLGTKIKITLLFGPLP
tara:strand:+ start:159 stop:371 length:213 start_codon:yes stop_codon:yes gene_type:complete